MYNIEQLREYPMIRESGMTLDNAIVQEKIRRVVLNTRTNNFPEILTVSRAAEEKIKDDKAKIVAQELARYRILKSSRETLFLQHQSFS